jgi:cation diffusion facilitator family transporter
MNKERNQFLAEFEGWISIVANALLFIFKFWVGLKSGSVAIIADAWHTLSDSLSSVILLFGVKISGKPADREHPFGHGRAELIAAVIIGVLLSMVAFEFLWKSVERLNAHKAADYGDWALWAMIITIIVKEAMAQYAFWAGKKTGMTSLKADAWHHRSDAISSVIILVAIIFGKHIWWIDGTLGIVVALVIFYAAYDILKTAISPLLGRSPKGKLIKSVKDICEECGGHGIHAHHFHMHEYGHHTELTFHIRLDGKMSLEEAHAVCKKIENALIEQLDLYPTIHMDPK